MRELWISPTQDETFNLCNRKWALRWVFKLPEVQKNSQSFGTATHSVCERYLGADDNGRDRKTGQPVELYPKDWHVVEDRSGQVEELTVVEQALIMELVEQAIDSGILTRVPGGRVEHKMERHLCDVELENGEVVRVIFIGYIDYLVPGEVHDHKTTKAMKWAKSKNKLAKATPMLAYGQELLFEAEERGEPKPDSIVLQHNVFCKDPEDKRVKRTRVEVPVANIEANWQRLKLQAPRMLAVAAMEEWHEIPDPDEYANACNAYGGCSYRSICGGQETLDGYKNRMARLAARNEATKKPDPIPQAGARPQVSVADRLAKTRERLAAAKGAEAPAAAATASVNGPAPAPAPSSMPPQFPGADEAQEATGAPWADPDCKACGGAGFNTKGAACRICAATASKRGVPSPKDFTIVADAGLVVWEPNDGVEAEGGEMAIPGGEAQAVTPATATAPETAPEPPSETLQVSPVVETVETPEAELPKEPGSKGRGRPKKGFTLLVNCGFTRRIGNSKLLYLEDIFKDATEAMAKQMGVESWYELDAFKRRDLLARNAEAIAADFGTAMVQCNVAATDERHFVDALRALAGTVIEGTR